MSRPLQLGMDAVGVMATVVTDLTNGIIRLSQVPLAPRAHRRLPDLAYQHLLRRARCLHDEFRLPFWDCLLLESSIESSGLPQPIAAAAAYHQTISESRQTLLPAAPNLEASMRQHLKSSAGTSLIVVSSLCSGMNEQPLHVPMLDFSVPSGVSQERTALTILNQLSCPGALLSSGRSYHFYGSRLMDNSTMRRFLGEALLFAPITDARWIAHQLIEGACALRLGGSRHTDRAPHVVALLG